jgi:hypothetical protein
VAEVPDLAESYRELFFGRGAFALRGFTISRDFTPPFPPDTGWDHGNGTI